MTAAADYFDALYQAEDDPWGVDGRWYEQRKRDLLLAMLPRERYGFAFEPGCGIGHMTAGLAGRCDQLVAADFSRMAVQATRRRLHGRSDVEVRQLHLPAEWPPDRTWDLVILSEWAYYLDDADLQQLCRIVADSVSTAQGDVVSCHFVRPFNDRQQSTARVHSCLRAALGPPWCTYEDPDFHVQVWAGRARQAGWSAS